MKRDELLDLNEVLQHPGRRLVVDISTELANDPEIELIDSVEGTIEAVSTGNLLLLEGEFKSTCIVECARCSAPLEKEVSFKMEEQFPVEGVPSAYSAQDYARVKPDEPFPLFQGNNLIPNSWIRQGLLINLPMQPLCSYGWEGDCPNAKAKSDLKESPHGRPEFEKLAKLRHITELEEPNP